jgi:hypothetical protein
VVTVIRVSDVAGAEAIKLNTASYEPRAAEIRTALTNWAINRYRILKETAHDDFKQNYRFLSSAIISRVKPADTLKVANILAGVEPEQTVEIKAIAIPAFRMLKPGVFAGRAQMELQLRKTLELPAADDPTKQNWRVDVEYMIDPGDAANRAVGLKGYAADPEYQVINPLGITINGFYETARPLEAELRR